MPAFDSSGIEIPPPREQDLEHLCEIGGQFESCFFYIEYFHDSLDKDAISNGLGLMPSQAWNAGERHPIGNGSSGTTRVDDYGKWALKVPVKSGLISDALRHFFDSCAAPVSVWRALNQRWDGRVALVGYAGNWNREFSLSSEVIAAIADRGLALNFDAYFTGAESDVEPIRND